MVVGANGMAHGQRLVYVTIIIASASISHRKNNGEGITIPLARSGKEDELGGVGEGAERAEQNLSPKSPKSFESGLKREMSRN